MSLHADAEMQRINREIADKDERERKQRKEAESRVTHMPTGPAI